MKGKNVLKYLIYLLVIAGLYWSGTSIIAEYYRKAQMTFVYNYWSITLVGLIFFGGIGVVLGLDKFLEEFKCTGKWKIDIPKLIILVIPSLIFSIPYLILSFRQLSITYGNIFIISSIVFGYSSITSLVKEC